MNRRKQQMKCKIKKLTKITQHKSIEHDNLIDDFLTSPDVSRDECFTTNLIQNQLKDPLGKKENLVENQKNGKLDLLRVKLKNKIGFTKGNRICKSQGKPQKEKNESNKKRKENDENLRHFQDSMTKNNRKITKFGKMKVPNAISHHQILSDEDN